MADIVRGIFDDLPSIDRLEQDDQPTPRPKPAYKSRFGFLPFDQLDAPGPEHEYIIDGFLSVGDKSIIGGPSRSGKSFLAIHLAFCISLGRDFFGRKCLAPGLVVIQAGEGARGLRKRLRAYRQHYGVPDETTIPLALLQSKVDLYRSDSRLSTKPFIEELKWLSERYGLPIQALFIDTFGVATAGADENSGKDMGFVMDNADMIQAATGAHVSFVHHLNADGSKLRGHTSIMANIDQVILVKRDEETGIRTVKLDKQKDDEDNVTIRFELLQVETGRVREIDGKRETSCVCVEVGGKAEARQAADAKGFTLRDHEEPIFRAILAAAKERGSVADEEQMALGAPAGSICVHYRDWRAAYMAARAPEDDTPDTSPEGIRKANEAVRKVWERKTQGLIKYGIIGYSKGWIWRLPKAVKGYPETMDAARTWHGQIDPADNDF